MHTCYLTIPRIHLILIYRLGREGGGKSVKPVFVLAQICTGFSCTVAPIQKHTLNYNNSHKSLVRDFISEWWRPRLLPMEKHVFLLGLLGCVLDGGAPTFSKLPSQQSHIEYCSGNELE